MSSPTDLEIRRALRELRVDPPDNGFEARLRARLEAAEPSAPSRGAGPTAKAAARGSVATWARRAPVRVLATAGLLFAGAAAALEGGVVAWVGARLREAVPAERADATTALPPRSPSQRGAPPAVRETELPALRPSPRPEPPRPAAPEPAEPSRAPAPAAVPRLELPAAASARALREGAAERRAPSPKERPASEHDALRVPRVELTPREPLPALGAGPRAPAAAERGRMQLERRPPALERAHGLRGSGRERIPRPRGRNGERVRERRGEALENREHPLRFERGRGERRGR